MTAARVLHIDQKEPFRNDGKHWDAADYKKLASLYEQGKRWGEISYLMGRTVPTCVNNLRALRKFSKMPKDIWRPRPLYKLKKLQVVGRE